MEGNNPKVRDKVRGLLYLPLLCFLWFQAVLWAFCGKFPLLWAPFKHFLIYSNGKVNVYSDREHCIVIKIIIKIDNEAQT
jgi:hypothetical protein